MSALVCLLSAAIFTPVYALAGINNPGFESGLDGWSTSPLPGSVVAVQTENGDDSPTYADMGITIEPFRGDWMARTG